MDGLLTWTRYSERYDNGGRVDDGIFDAIADGRDYLPFWDRDRNHV